MCKEAQKKGEDVTYNDIVRIRDKQFSIYCIKDKDGNNERNGKREQQLCFLIIVAIIKNRKEWNCLNKFSFGSFH